MKNITHSSLSILVVLILDRLKLLNRIASIKFYNRFFLYEILLLFTSCYNYGYDESTHNNYYKLEHFI